MTSGRRNGDDLIPVRGTPGGWRDIWDDPDDSADLRERVEASERRHLARAEVLGVAWQGEIRAATVVDRLSTGTQPSKVKRRQHRNAG